MWVLEGCRQKRRLVTIARVAMEEIRTFYGLVEEYGREIIVAYSDRRGAPPSLGLLA